MLRRAGGILRFLRVGNCPQKPSCVSYQSPPGQETPWKQGIETQNAQRAVGSRKPTEQWGKQIPWRHLVPRSLRSQRFARVKGWNLLPLLRRGSTGRRWSTSWAELGGASWTHITATGLSELPLHQESPSVVLYNNNCRIYFYFHHIDSFVIYSSRVN